jgi:hypothetical protein
VNGATVMRCRARREGPGLNEFEFVELQVAHGWVVGKWHPEARTNQDRDADLQLFSGGLEPPEVFGQESNTSEVPAPSTLRCAHYPIASYADPADLRLVYLMNVPSVLTVHRRVALSSQARNNGLFQ